MDEPRDQTGQDSARQAGFTVSVVLAVYNGDAYLDRSIRSVLDQSHKDFEFIILNDGSTDRSLEIIEGFSKQDPRIVVLNQENRGLTASLNRMIHMARGRLIVRQDADDISLPSRLEVLIREMEDRSLICFHTRTSLVRREGSGERGSTSQCRRARPASTSAKTRSNSWSGLTAAQRLARVNAIRKGDTHRPD